MNIDTTTFATVANAAPKGTGKSSIDQAGFLKLLTTQLKTQDPFQPMDAQAMTSQMQQLSQTSGIAEMSVQLKALAATLSANRLGDASGWIGKNALVASDFAYPDTTGAVRGQVNLDSAADSVTIDFLDTSGLIVHSQSATKVAAGPMTFDWRPDAALSGPVRVRAIARHESKPVATTTNVWTPITAVQSPAGSGTQRLVTPNGLIAPDAAIALG